MNVSEKSEKKADNSPKFGHDNENESDSDLENVQEYDVTLDDPLNKYLIKMLNLAREVALFCLFIVAYAAFTNNPPKVSKPPAAYPFFPKHSLVIDWYRGEISKAVEQARLQDMSFIMYYAPWDAQSQAVRKEFESAAAYMHNQVVFMAVNCWQPHGECRSQYLKVYRWPVFIAYLSHGRGVQYSGPMTAAHFISFLKKVSNPIRRAGVTDIYDFEEAFLVAELNTLPGSSEYGNYYVAALRYMEKDPLFRVTFYVKPIKTSKLKLSLYLWNQVRMKDFDHENWVPDKIVQWVFKQFDQPSSWVSPSGAKSLVLSNVMQPGPTLVMFTPNNPLHNQKDYYIMLQEISQDYNNCDDIRPIFDMPGKRLSNKLEHNFLSQRCTMGHNPPRPKIISIVPSKSWSNTTETKVVSVCRNLKTVNFEEFVPDIPYSSQQSCKNIKSEPVEMFKTSMLPASDSRSMKKLTNIVEKEKCRQFLTAEKIQPEIFEHKDQNRRIPYIVGLSCKYNRSLNFLAMDSLIHYSYAESLGIDLSKEEDKSAVVIVDQKHETHYIMEHPINSVKLRQFIIHFMSNKLSRSVNSSTSIDSKNTHSYSFSPKKGGGGPTMYIEELNSKNFLETVLQNNKAVILMYYSKQCSFCNGISYTFLTLARKLSLVENLKFTRIDGDLNILPWEYTMEKFPTILFFPANKKSESRIFPPNLFVTVPNLLGFVLMNLNPVCRLQAMYSLCMHCQFKEEKPQCLTQLRNETLTVIEITLKEWRKSNNRQRQHVSYNLKQLKHLQFLFGHTPNDFDAVQTYFRKLNMNKSEDYSYIVRKSAFKDEL